MSGGMMGAVRVTSRAAGFRRAGFAFGPTARTLTSDEVTPTQLLQLLDEPRLLVELLNADGTPAAFGPTERAAFVALAKATVGLSPAEVSAGLRDGRFDRTLEDALIPRVGALGDASSLATLALAQAADSRPATVAAEHPEALDAAARMAASDIAGSVPGKGAGADHPASETDLVEQPVVGPNPALPVAGGVSDNATAAKAVESKPVGPEPTVAAAVDAVVAPGKQAATEALTQPSTPPRKPRRPN